MNQVYLFNVYLSIIYSYIFYILKLHFSQILAEYYTEFYQYISYISHMII